MTTDSPSTGERELVFSRVFDAPRELVFAAFTDPEHLARWWGPSGFTTTTRAMTVEPGGAWRFVMHGPDGRDYENHIDYREVVPPELLVYEHGGGEECEPISFQVRVTFEADGEGTRLTMRSLFPSVEERDRVIREYGADEGGRQTLARLGEYLREVSGSAAGEGGHPPFVITRVLRASPEVVWQTWTEAEHLARWFGPKGCTLEVQELDARPGGTFRYAMRFEGRPAMYGKWVFRELVAPARLVMETSFCDAEGTVIPAPFDMDFPVRMLSVVTFEPHAGKGLGTVVRLETTALRATAAQGDVFFGMHGSMQQGWGGTFEQLEAHLGSLPA